MMKTKLKFFLVLLAMMVGVNGTWGAKKLYFEYNVIEFGNSDYPESDEGGTYYQQPLLWLWNDEDPTETPTNLSGSEGDFVWTVTTTEDMRITSYTTKIDDYNYVVSGSKIYFAGATGVTNPRGTIVVTATNPDFGGVTYSCSYTISYHMDNKKWSFYSKKLIIGRYKDSGSVFRVGADAGNWNLQNVTTTVGDEVNVSESVYWYVDSSHPINDKDVSDPATFGLGSEYNNRLFSEAAGLKFNAPNGTFGMYNESDLVDEAAPDRFIALKVGASVTIPHSYFSSLANPRIRIKMGRYGGPDADHAQINLTITNGKDALGNAISGDGTYQIGGSAWWGAKNDKHQRGEYHFIINDKSQDFTIYVHAGQWLKLYTIEVYNSETMITENSVLGTNYQLLTKKVNGTTTYGSGTYYLHYRGKGEHSHVTTNLSDNYAPTGTVYPQASYFSNYNGGTEHTYTASTQYETEVPFGTFQIRLDCYTLNGSYCTDYADRSQSAGYIEKQTYPCTWDFTDIAKYAYSGNAMWWEGQYNDVPKYNGRSNWEIKSGSPGESCRCGHQLGWDASGHNVVYCGGSQLWCGKQILPEIAGLGFTPSNFSSSYNNSLQLLPSGNYYQIKGTNYHGIKINQNQTSWWCYRITVPEVPEGGAVYARVHPLPSPADAANPTENEAKYPIAGYTYGDYKKPVVKNNVTIDAGNVDVAIGSDANTKVIDAADGTGDKIYVIPGTSASESTNITLYFNGVIIQKIAVSTDKKTFNAKGWTTESRAHDIDPSLTAEMNGRGIKTFLVTNNDIHYDTKKVTMTDISNAGLMHFATDGSKYACILQNTEEAPLDVVNGGFYLFVPDMHDEQGSTTGDGYKLKNYPESMESSVMKAQVSPIASNATDGRIPATDGSNTNFAFTYKYYDLDAHGYKKSDATLQYGVQAFYRISMEGASSIGNQGYLPLYTNSVGGGWEPLSSRFSIMFSDDDNEPDQETTKIETISDNMQNTRSEYYNLNGQQFNGSPTRRGLYIVNGKKICIM